MSKILSGVSTIYLVGIGGIGVSGIALLLKEKGFRVCGSDLTDTATVQLLRQEGIQVYIGHDARNIPDDTGLLAYSSAVKPDNPEIMEARRRGITVLKRGELLGLLTWDKKTIAIGGSHGKTTTSAFIGYLLTALGYKPMVCVGGVPLNYTKNAWWGEEYFVIETDESDGSFLYYNPWVSVITNIDAEHIEHYGSEEQLQAAFLKFAYQTKGKVFGCAQDPVVCDIVKKTNGARYGWSRQDMYSAGDVTYDEKFTYFSFYIDGAFVAPVKIPLMGEHNVLNTLAVLGFFHYFKEDIHKVISLMEGFKGIKRRFHVRARVSGITFVDDYGHHPTEINAVLKAAKNLSAYARVVAVFQPHRYSRVRALYEEFGRCFTYADEVIVTDIYAASEQEIPGITAELIVEQIQKNFKGVVTYISKEQLIQKIPAHVRPGDIVMAVGAGDINIVMERVVREFTNARV